ncbi:5-methylaminomethyl-2-thiouridylate methyltransferase tRNA [Gigaspora margarita]|nr:5-methylaminomethyl-2-thiouridylate methyltransferase tRNA [Gigaspora margarita]
MIEDYENGFTPNPDIICNREIKFGLFLDKCLGSMFNAKWFATGHYVQVDHIHDRVKLLRGVDSTKDQSYFLSAVPEEKLKWAIFPVGKLYKTQVKSIASNANLITANKQESMGVCFIGKKKKFAEFLKQYLVTKPGDIKTIDGRIIGQHCGLFAYTIGQCAHINYGTNRWFVLKRNTKDNTLIVVPESNNPLLFSRSLVAKNWTWYFPPEKIKNDIKLLAQIRYHQSPVSCTVISRSNGRYFVEFETPQRAIAPGQVVVIWDNNWCLGSGVIEYAL